MQVFCYLILEVLMVTALSNVPTQQFKFKSKLARFVSVHWVLSALVGTVMLSIVGCGQSQSPQQGAGAMPAMPVSVLNAQLSAVPIQTEVVGQTEGAKEVEIRPRVGGIVLKKLFTEGATIRAGQAMFLIDPAPFKAAADQARAQVAQQKARIEQAQREAARLKGLLDTQSISQREYDNAMSEQAIATANLMQAQAQLREAELNVSYTTVVAPASGVAGRFLLSEGALVAANTSLLTTVSQIAPIWVRFSLSESELASLGGQLSPQQVKHIGLRLPDGSDYTESGKLNFSASIIDPSLGTQQMRAEFANANKALLPGQFVRVIISTGVRDDIFLLPQTAVLTGEQGKFVYVVEKDKSGKVTAGVRPITEAGWYQQQWVVLSGIKAGDQVLVDNLIKVRPGAEIAPHLWGDPPTAPAMPAKKKASTHA
jgi:membrane fusion protein, multidrug efflux system